MKEPNYGVLSIYQLFYVHYKVKALLFLNLYFCCLVKKGWTLKVAKQFSLQGIVAYKPVAYKKNKCISYIYFKTHFCNIDFYEFDNSFLSSLSKQLVVFFHYFQQSGRARRTWSWNIKKNLILFVFLILLHVFILRKI